MSDTVTNAIDPKRPWLTDERELPGHMNWFQTLFNPTGKSPRLHFTRAWTVLFFLQLSIIVLPFTVALVLNMAGGDGKPVGTFGVYATPIVFIVTTLMSYVIHSRRLNDADKTPLLAILPLLPLVIALVLFLGAAQQQSAAYDKKFEARQDYLANPEAFRAKQRAERQQAQADAEAKAAEAAEAGEESEAASPPQQRRGPANGHPVNLDKPLDPKAPTVLKGALPTIQMVMIPLSGFVAIWSLMWLARAPFFGRYPGAGTMSDSRVYES